jgi:aspartate aminotransferase/aminotransferase
MTRIVDTIPQAGSIRINQEVTELKRAGKDVTVLSLGEAFFDIPAFDFGKLDFTSGYHYADSRGVPGLRRRIAHEYRERYGVPVDADTNVLISTGSKTCIYLALRALLSPGDEVLVQEPYWLSYPAQVTLAGGVTKAMPHWTTPASIAEYISDKTRVLILNNPNNPAGSVFSEAALRSIVAICKKRGVTLLIDEAYSDFCLGGTFVSGGRVDEALENVVIVNSLSKNMGMSGWRLGYVLANERLTNDILKINQHLVTCAPTILQMYCDMYWSDIRACVEPQVRAVVEKRERIARAIDRIGLGAMNGASTFYFMIDIAPSGLDSEAYAERLLRERAIAVVPGRYYGVSTDRFVRVGIGTESEPRIEAALTQIRETLSTRNGHWQSPASPQPASNVGAVPFAVESTA